MLALEIEDFRRHSMGQSESFEVEQVRKSWKKKKQDSWMSNGSFAFDEKDEEENQGTSKRKSISCRMPFDELLPHVGEYGLYQVILFLLLCPFLFFLAFVFMSQMFITLVPNDHWCEINGLKNYDLTDIQIKEIFIPKIKDNQYSRCTRYDVDPSKVLNGGINMTEIALSQKSWDVIECNSGWKYNRTEVSYWSLGMEFNWVCDQAYYPNVAISVYYVGAILGGLLFGYLSDHYGRLPTLVIANVVALVFGISTIFATDFWTFAFYRFMVGFAYDNCYVMLYIIVLEYTGVRWRTFVSNMSIGMFFTAAMCLVPWIAIWCEEWRIFVLVTSVPIALALLAPFVVPESARWLLSMDRVEKCVKIMRGIAKINRKKVDESVYKHFYDSNFNDPSSFDENTVNYTLLDLFKSPRMRKITFLLCVMWMTTSLVFEGHARNAGSIGSNIFVVHSIGSFTEFPADIILVLILDTVGRRWCCSVALMLGGVFSLLATLVPFGVYSATLAILGRATANFSYNLGVQYAAELLPTVVRGQGLTFVHIMGYVASMAAPLVVYLSNIWTLLPMIVLGIVGLVGGFCCLFLPESLGHDLPQTIVDGENIGRDQKFFDFPCCGKRKISKQDHANIVKIIVTNADNNEHYH
uniref:CSON007857 protein n=1 Tax=Culicoides sonorensis TaxID=179676 RepID=A0A336MA72_CULSO